MMHFKLLSFVHKLDKAVKFFTSVALNPGFIHEILPPSIKKERVTFQNSVNLGCEL
jgi:hypothetical protein